MAGIPNFTETMLRTLTAAFSPQIVTALGEILEVAKHYDERMQRMEAMIEVLLLRSAPNDQKRIADEHTAADPNLHG